jgi:hypothetical protein
MTTLRTINPLLKYMCFENRISQVGESHKIRSLTEVMPNEICSTFNGDPINEIVSVRRKIKHTWTDRKAHVHTWFPVMKGAHMKYPYSPNGSEQYRWLFQSRDSRERDGRSLSV